MRGQVQQGDGAALGLHGSVVGRVLGQGVGQLELALGRQRGQHVAGEHLGYRRDPEDGMFVRLNAVARRRLAVALNDDVVAPHHGDDQRGRAGVQVQLHAGHGHGVLQGQVGGAGRGRA
ncbi:hypothetical protein D3C72_1933500 [compost metagenome]